MAEIIIEGNIGSQDLKAAILHLLSQEMAPISLPALMQKARLNCSGRTARRWLNQLIQEGSVCKTGKTKNVKYRLIKKESLSSDIVSSLFSDASLKAIEEVKRPLYERHPIAYNNEWLDSYIPNKSYYLEQSVRQQLYEAGKRANNHEPAGTYAHQIFNRLLIDLSYNSSRLEGNTYSLIDTERLLLHGDSAPEKLEEEKVMILNHKEAIRYLVDNASHLIVETKSILTIHYLLSEGLVEGKYAGKIRDHGVRIGGSTYIPYENPHTLQSQLEKILEKGRLIHDPYELSLFLLTHLSYLQAFIDVNKRTARLCSNIPLLTHNLVPLSFNYIEIDAYISSMLAIYELQNISPIKDLYISSYLRTCIAYDETVKAVGFDEIRVRYRQQRRHLLGEIIKAHLTGPRMAQFIQEKAHQEIPENDRESFIDDVMEDLEMVDESRITGLGVTPQQLISWQERL